MAELKPCPFCGTNQVKIHYPYFSDTLCYIRCYECNCITALYTKPELAAEAWNRRADLPEPPKE